MTLPLIAAALVTAMNPLRLAVAAPSDPLLRSRTVALAVCGMVGSGVLLAWWSSPIAGSVDVSGSSTIIAAGLALVVIGARDAIIRPPEADTGLNGVGSALVPMFFPTLFTPAMAILAIASGIERGVLSTLAALVIAGVIIAAVTMGVSPDLAKRRRSSVRLSASVTGLLGVVLGGVVATHGVMSI